MNWDWEKLQDKRRRQGGNSRKPEEEPEGPFGPENGGGRGDSGIRQMNEAFKQLRRSRLPVFKILLVLLLLGWLASGIFIVNPEEVGVITRFGKYNRRVDPGPHYHLPYPIEQAMTPKVLHMQRVEIGFRNVRANTGQAVVRGVLEEAAMLTGDENIVNVQFIVQYQIKDPVDFLFKADLQISNLNSADIYSETVKNAAQAAMREVIGGSLIDSALTDGKNQIQLETRDLLQNILDRYSSGIQVQAVQLQDVTPPQEVSASFKDVASAREDRIRSINEAEAYSNEILPRTRGEAAEILNRAEAYKKAVAEKANGDAQRFLSVLAEYNKAKEVTQKRMYLETMEAILSSPGMEKVIIGGEAGRAVLPFLPLNRAEQPQGGR
ncbi:MAG: FtsH protease activity modulator HflK [Desulfovibrionaceae bacterium]|nr:FtsH protease activity modulator HflK [Desulfovibrionaceae bacterium]